MMMPGVAVRRCIATPTVPMRQHLSSLFVPQKRCGLSNHLDRCMQGNCRLPRTPYAASNVHFTAVRLIFFLTLQQCFNQRIYLRFFMITALNAESFFVLFNRLMDLLAYHTIYRIIYQTMLQAKIINKIHTDNSLLPIHIVAILP